MWISVVLYGCLLVGCYAQEQEKRGSDKGSGTNPKQLAADVVSLSKSPKIDDRIQSANLIAFFPALISSKTEKAVINILAGDVEPRVRVAALGAMEGLVDIALIKPFLPLAKKMESDPDAKVSNEARRVRAFMEEQNAVFEKQGVTEELARKKAFTGGVVPELY